MRRHYSAPRFGYELQVTAQAGQEDDRKSSGVSQLTRNRLDILHTFHYYIKQLSQSESFCKHFFPF